MISERDEEVDTYFGGQTVYQIAQKSAKSIPAIPLRRYDSVAETYVMNKALMKVLNEDMPVQQALEWAEQEVINVINKTQQAFGKDNHDTF